MKLLYPTLCALLLAGCAGPNLHKLSTTELQFQRSQDIEFIATAPYQPHIMAAERRTEDKENIERELFHRWQAGDHAADLPLFHTPHP